MDIGTLDVFPRKQRHLHAGSVGWITLSLIRLAIWVFTGQREVSEAYAHRTRALVWLGVLVFAGYIASFEIAFSRGGGAFGFGILAVAAVALVGRLLARQGLSS